MEKTIVMQEFENLSMVPRCSDNNEKIVKYCLDWAESHGFESYYDEKNVNVVIISPATPGYEDKSGIVLQGHLDMVPVCDPGVEHDWFNDPLDLYVENGCYRARGTTLGADDGVAAAISFAVLQDKKLPHPRLEVLLTTNEETGMDSVRDADLTYLKGEYLVNIDCGPDDTFVIGCCGGKSIGAAVDNLREPADGACVAIEIGGLVSGHSGMEVDRERANAIKVMGAVLQRIKKNGFRISAVEAEGKENAISGNCRCVICTDKPEEVKSAVKEAERDYKIIYRVTEPGLFIKASDSHCDTMLKEESSRALAFLMLALPTGLLNREQNLGGNETSENMGLVITDDNQIRIAILARSSVEERLNELCGLVEGLCEICGAKPLTETRGYPGWMPDFGNPFLERMAEIYKEKYGCEPKIETIHAGLECGFIMKNSNLKGAVALGTNTMNEHTTREALPIDSLNKLCDFVKEVVSRL